MTCITIHSGSLGTEIRSSAHREFIADTDYRGNVFVYPLRDTDYMLIPRNGSIEICAAEVE